MGHVSPKLSQTNEGLPFHFKQTWLKTTDVNFIKSDEVAPKQLDSIKSFLTKANYNYAVVPDSITTDIASCRWINNNIIIQLIHQNPGWYTSLDMDAQCGLLSYAVQSENDLVSLINLSLLPLTSGGYFKLQQNQYGGN